MEPEGLSPHSQEPATYPYPKSDLSSLFPPQPTSRKFILILSSHLRLGLPSGLLPWEYPSKGLRLRMEERRPDMKGSCKYTE